MQGFFCFLPGEGVLLWLCCHIETSLRPGVDSRVTMDMALCGSLRNFLDLSVTGLKPRVCVLEQIMPPPEQGRFTEGFWGTLRETCNTAGTWAQPLPVNQLWGMQAYH